MESDSPREVATDVFCIFTFHEQIAIKAFSFSGELGDNGASWRPVTDHLVHVYKMCQILTSGQVEHSTELDSGARRKPVTCK